MSKYETLEEEHTRFLKRCLSGKTLGFHWRKDFTEVYIEIEIPPLTDNQFSTWGDWGPMYKFEMLPNQYVKLAAKSNNMERIDSHTLESRHIELNSPAHGELRTQYPLYFKVDDPRKKLFYEIYLDTSGEPARVKIYRQEEKGLIFETDQLNLK